jgi:hypothetical protein
MLARVSPRPALSENLISPKASAAALAGLGVEIAAFLANPVGFQIL